MFFRKTAYRYKRKYNFTHLFVVLGTFCIVMTFYKTYANFRPTLEGLAINECLYEASKAINSNVSDKLSQNNLLYGSFVTLERDTNDKVCALSTNMVNMNRLKADVVNCVYDTLSSKPYGIVRIPVGNLFQGEWLSGVGPSIPVRYLNLGMATADFISVFSSAGINQTRHRIVMDVTVDIKILLPGKDAISSLGSQFIISETILVGNVPESFTYIEDSDSTLLERINDYDFKQDKH